MSLIPISTFFHDDDLRMMNPARIYNQHFGMPLVNMEREMERAMASFPYWMRQPLMPGGFPNGFSEIKSYKEKLQVNLDVRHFTPQELQVKLQDNYLVIEGKHEEKTDEHGLISRQFTRKYLLPKDVDQTKISSTLGGEGLLTIEVPKIVAAPAPEKKIPIEMKKADITNNKN